jgi:hypothetical protein
MRDLLLRRQVVAEAGPHPTCRPQRHRLLPVCCRKWTNGAELDASEGCQRRTAGRLTCGFVGVELRGFEPLASCMPSRDLRYGAHNRTLRCRAMHQSSSAGAWWLVWARPAELLRRCCAPSGPVDLLHAIPVTPADRPSRGHLSPTVTTAQGEREPSACGVP